MDQIQIKEDGSNELAFLSKEKKPFTGKAECFYENGQKKEEINFKNGMNHGLWTEWYENGHKKSEENYLEGKEDGLETEWYENGQKSFQTNYKNGKEDGLFTYWDENGNKELVINYKNGKQLSKEKYNKDGSRKGFFKSLLEDIFR